MQQQNTNLALDVPTWRWYRNGMTHLKKLREAKGLSQAKLADMAGTSQPQIKRLENGERKLTAVWAERIAPHLGVSARELMFPSATASDAIEAEEETGSSYEQIGRRLGKLRQALGMDPIEIAHELDIPASEWDSYEAGIALIQIDLIPALIRLMPGLTTDWILFGNRSKLTVEVDNALRTARSAARR